MSARGPALRARLAQRFAARIALVASAVALQAMCANQTSDPRVTFIFEGIGRDEVIDDFGTVLGGPAGDEIDRFDALLGSPTHALIVATSAGRHTDYYQVTSEDVPITPPGQGGTESPKARADRVFFETPNGGAVFSVGSINWRGSRS